MIERLGQPQSDEVPDECYLVDESGQEGVAPVPRLSVVWGNQVVPVPIEWLWPGRIPFGKITLTEGDPNQGKSTVTVDIAARVTRGRPMPDGTGGGAPARVLIVSAEDAIEDTILPRLMAADADVGMVAFHRLKRDEAGEVVPLVIPDSLRALERLIADHAIRLVVIDPFVAYLNERIQSHNDASVRQAMSPLADTAQRSGAAVVGLRHYNKGSGLAAIHRGGGSVGLGAAARSVLAFVPHPDAEAYPGLHVMAQAKGNLSRAVPSLGYRIENETVALPGGRLVGMPAIRWSKASVDLTADELLNPKTGRDAAPARDEAKTWLRTQLATGPVQTKVLKERAARDGVAWRTLENVKADGLAVVEAERDRGGKLIGWAWHLVVAAPVDGSPG